jgi:iron complex outermembrane receptor protein
MRYPDLFTRLKLGGSALALATVASAVFSGALAQGADTGVESVTVSGFKASLERALDEKRSAAGATDRILAEDIAKFPDTNLSESIQRIPGVALNRTAGEGKQIAVRGLSPLFTTTEINGMETITNSNSTGRSFDFNVFDSDLFSAITVNKTAAANLHEGALGATIQLQTPHPFDHQGFTLVGSGQGSYNDLNGAINKRFSGLISDTFMGGKLGVLFAGAYQSRKLELFDTDSVGFQNDNTAQNAQHSSPLIAGCQTNVPGVAAQCSLPQRFGSVTVQGTGLPGTIPQVAGTRQTNGNGAPCPVGALPSVCLNGNGANFNSAQLPNDYDVVNEAYHDRFPRYIPGYQKQDRTGFTGSLQYQPDDATLITIDALWADLYQVNDNSDIVSPAFGISGTGSNLAPNGAPPLRANTLGNGNINILDYRVDQARNNLTYLAATNVGLTSERSGTQFDTRFSQVSLNASHEFSDAFKVDGRAGWSESHFRTRRAYLFKMDYDCTAATSTTGAISGCPGGVGGGVGTAAAPYIADLRYPLGTFANSVGQIDPTSTNGWFVTQYRNTPVFNYTSYRSVDLHASWKASDELSFEAGFDYKNFGYRTQKLARFNGSTASLDSFIPTELQNAPLASITEIYSLRGMSAPPPTATSWVTLSPAKLDSLFHVFDPTAANYVWPGTSTASGSCLTTGCSAYQLGPGQYLTQNGTIRENDFSGWGMLNWDTTIGRVPFRGNIGLRYATTSTEGQGYNFDPVAKAIVPVLIKNDYHDWLPSINAVLSPADDFLIRMSAAEVMSRPNLPDLVPGISASKSGTGALSISGGNALLRPYRAKDADMSFEWYYSKGALFSVAFFYKHIDTLIASQNTNTAYTNNPFGLPTSIALAACGGVFTSFCDPALPANFTFKVNQKGSPLYGTEINLQQPFDFLPDFWSNFGALANVTFVQARQNYLAANGTVQAVADLENMSRTSYNATFYYDDSVFQARISANFRSKYLDSGGVNPGNNNDLRIIKGSLNYDASASYKVNDNFTITMQGINLSNEPIISYLDSVGQRLNHGDWTGREIYLGLRYSY